MSVCVCVCVRARVFVLSPPHGRLFPHLSRRARFHSEHQNLQKFTHGSPLQTQPPLNTSTSRDSFANSGNRQAHDSLNERMSCFAVQSPVEDGNGLFLRLTASGTGTTDMVYRLDNICRRSNIRQISNNIVVFTTDFIYSMYDRYYLQRRTALSTQTFQCPCLCVDGV